MEKQYLDREGLSFLASNINTRLKAVAEMPTANVKDKTIRLFVGETTADFIKGHIYQASVANSAISWADITPLPAAPIIAKGTITFDELKDLEDVKVGWMYNISDDFITTSDFTVSGVSEKAGSNVYCIEVDDQGTKKWDVFAAPETIVVDKHFDEKSKNAQSGKAVAEAIKPFIKAVTTMPEKASNGETVAYVGESDQYAKGHLYEAKVTISDTWTPKTWNGLAQFYGQYTWTDGNNIYYSGITSSSNAGIYQYVLDKSTNKWSTKTWNGCSNFKADDIWTDGENIYCTTTINSAVRQYVLDKATSTWTEKTWKGSQPALARFIWTDGDNIYYSNDSKQYVLDKITSTWSKKTWTGLSSFQGDCIWTDGDNIYYSNGSSYQYVLDKATSTWTEKTWKGLTNLNGSGVWSDGDNIYYNGYILDKITNTWNVNNISIDKRYAWLDGDNIYYSNGTQHYVLTKTTSWTDLTSASSPTAAISTDDLDELLE